MFKSKGRGPLRGNLKLLEGYFFEHFWVFPNRPDPELLVHVTLTVPVDHTEQKMLQKSINIL